MITLVQLDQPEERIAEVAQRLLDRAEDEQADLPRSLALGRLLVAQLLGAGERGSYSYSAQALSDVASFYWTDDDPLIRAVAAWAIEDRIQALIHISDLDGVEAAWESLRVQYSAETEPAIRRRVAGAGRSAAIGFLLGERRADALRTSEEVIKAYGADTEAKTRAQVVAAMIVRFAALRRRQVGARSSALRDLLHFVGSTPEPEVVEAIRETHPGGADRLLRRAHDAHHLHPN